MLLVGCCTLCVCVRVCAFQIFWLLPRKMGLGRTLGTKLRYSLSADSSSEEWLYSVQANRHVTTRNFYYTVAMVICPTVKRDIASMKPAKRHRGRARRVHKEMDKLIVACCKKAGLKLKQ